MTRPFIVGQGQARTLDLGKYEMGIVGPVPDTYL